MLDIKITRTTTPKAKPSDESKLGFGKHFSDHMFLMDYTKGQGWHDARIVPYQPFQMDPACVVLHYAQEIFEGMKAYRSVDNTIQLFRPDCNAKRLQDSADRLCIPPIPEEDFVQAVKALVEVEKDWVPHTDGTSLYIRPFIFASDVGLGVHASHEYVFCIICAPSGAYYAEGINPVKIYVEDEYIRAAPGLTGFTKCGGNYAASIKAGELAEEQGFSQVPVSYTHLQVQMLIPLKEILEKTGIRVSVRDDKIILQLGNSVKELRVYPAMWKKPEEPECIFVSDSCLKYAKPYAIQQITNFL